MGPTYALSQTSVCGWLVRRSFPLDTSGSTGLFTWPDLIGHVLNMIRSRQWVVEADERKGCGGTYSLAEVVTLGLEGGGWGGGG